MRDLGILTLRPRGRGRRSRGLRRCACPRGARSHSGDNGATVEYRVSGVCLGERAVGATVRARVPLPFSVFEHPPPLLPYCGCGAQQI
jgi:hypothetical protein